MATDGFVFKARAEDVHMLRADRLIEFLQQLEDGHRRAGRVDHAQGVRTAIVQIQRAVDVPALAAAAR